MPNEDLVLSVPAGKSYDLILEHFIYSCPDNKNYQYDETELVTFRTVEGKMEKLFRIARVIRLDPRDVDAAFEVPSDFRERIKGYISVATNRGILQTEGPYRFYILDEEAVSNLAHAPHARQRLEGDHYFSRAELASGKAVVAPLL
jgi:hypothetical protein